MKTHGLRGSELETLINMTIEDYRKDGLAVIQKIPTPITPMKIDKETKKITLAYFLEKSTVDYIGVVQEIAVCFDAKECNSDTFPLNNIHEHQYMFMKEFEKQGGMAFLIIYFKKSEKFYYMTFKELSKLWDIKKTGKQSFNISTLDAQYFFTRSKSMKLPILEMIQTDINSR